MILTKPITTAGPVERAEVELVGVAASVVLKPLTDLVR